MELIHDWEEYSDNNVNISYQIGFVGYSGASAKFSNISVNREVINLFSYATIYHLKSLAIVSNSSLFTPI